MSWELPNELRYNVGLEVALPKPSSKGKDTDGTTQS